MKDSCAYFAPTKWGSPSHQSRNTGLPGLINGQITSEGHLLLGELIKKNVPSNIGFCAMWFANDMEFLWSEALIPGIANAGYEPKRIDKHEHINKIDDEIIAMIRNSKFVVADLTGHRQGVYFEAGFAMGLGIPVIWTCIESSLDDTHFDIRQYNALKWKRDELSIFSKALTNRIEAILGRGPLENTAPETVDPHSPRPVGGGRVSPAI